MALFFLTSLLLGSPYFLTSGAESHAEVGVLGGPEERVKMDPLPYEGTAIAESQIATNDPSAAAPSLWSSDATGDAISKTALTDQNSTIFNSPLNAGGIFTYKVKRGDTIAKIARGLGVSTQTIAGMNSGVSDRKLRQGQELQVLVSKSGDTSPSEVQSANVEVVFAAAKTLPRLAGYFKDPAVGFNWGRLHNYNAVDIANACGASVTAAAEGLVVPDENVGSGATGWNGGYGHFVLIEHPNGTKTRYAHLDEVLVSIGDYVAQGKEIGTMGNTGNVHGPTGCHLHFEVYGAQNPFAK